MPATYRQRILLLFALISATKMNARQNQICLSTTAYFNDENKMVAKKATNNCQSASVCETIFGTLQPCLMSNATCAHRPEPSLMKTMMQYGGYEANMYCTLFDNMYSGQKHCNGHEYRLACKCLTADCYTAKPWDVTSKSGGPTDVQPSVLTPRIVAEMFKAIGRTKEPWVNWKLMTVKCPTTTAFFTAYSELAFKHKTGECRGDGQTRCKTVFAFFDDIDKTNPSSDPTDAVRSSFSALTAGYSVVQSCDVGHAYPNVSQVFQVKPFGIGWNNRPGSYDYPYCHVENNVTSAAPRITCFHQQPGFDASFVHTIFLNGTVYKPKNGGIFKDLHDARPLLVKLVSSNPGEVRNETLLFTTTTTTPTTTTTTTTLTIRTTTTQMTLHISTETPKKCLSRSAFFSRDTTLVLKDAARTCLGRACQTVYGLMTERRLDELATAADLEAGTGLRLLLTDGFTVVQSCTDRQPPDALANVCRLENNKTGASPTIHCVCSTGGSKTCSEVISLGFGAGSVARLPTQQERRQMVQRVDQDRLAYTHDDLKPNRTSVNRARQQAAVAAAVFVFLVNAINLSM